MKKLVLFLLIFGIYTQGAFAVEVLKQYDFIYNNAVDLKLYKKLGNDTGNGTAITTIQAINPIAPGDGYIYYATGSGYIMKKNANDTGNGTVINSVSSKYLQYEKGLIYYVNLSNNNYIYMKWANDTNPGFQINTQNSSNLLINNGFIYYSNISDGGKIYTKTSSADNGTTSTAVGKPCFVLNDYLYYSDTANGNVLKKKPLVNGIPQGAPTTILNLNLGLGAPDLSPDGNFIIYGYNNLVYEKNIKSGEVKQVVNLRGQYMYYLDTYTTGTIGFVQSDYTKFADSASAFVQNVSLVFSLLLYMVLISTSFYLITKILQFFKL